MSSNNDDKKNNQNDDFDFFKIVSDSDDKNNQKKGKFPFWLLFVLVLLGFTLLNTFGMSRTSDKPIPFSEFRALVLNGTIKRVEISDSLICGYQQKEEKVTGTSLGSNFTEILQAFEKESELKTQKEYVSVPLITEDFIKLLDEKNVTYKIVHQKRNFILEFILQWILPFALIIVFWFFILKKVGGGVGGSIFSSGQMKSSAVDEGLVKTRFSDVAGVDEAKEELVEVVDFLKSPQKYTEIGGKIPKGVLLVGPPGTGKTLLARAVAGEAGVPFFRISGSDFVEMFVGVGASRVRDLFKQAREKSPCIIFIDELDAIGKSRVNGIGGGNDEREQTLNQLLVEMDGFDNTKGLILLAATNRPDVLDPAILRPGRFDRQVVVDRPDVKGREAILKIHAKNVKIENTVDFKALAHATAGMAGADLANVVNEAALLAVRCGRKMVGMADFDEAIEKTMIGLQKKSRVIKEKERKIISYHEIGHALVAAFTEGSDPVHKISIIPRGVSALGYTLHRPDDEKFLSSQDDMYGEIDCLLGGRAAEQVALKEISTGASNDIQRATDIVQKMITTYGMSDKFKNMTLGKSGAGYGAQEPQLVREYAETTQQYIDEEIARIIEQRYNRVLNLLKEKNVLLEYLAKRLLEKEVIDADEFYDIVKAEGNLTLENKEVGEA